MKREIIAIVADFLEVAPEELAEHKTLVDLNIDSLDFVEIVFEIEEKFKVSILSEMQRNKDQLHSLGDVLRLTEELIAKHRDAEPNSSNG